MSKASARNTEDSSPENSLDDYEISKRVLICFDNVAFFMSRYNIIPKISRCYYYKLPVRLQ